MQYRALGKTGLNVSVVGLGCAGLRPATVDYAAEMVHRCLDLGITYFDNARGYGDAEIKLGIALEGRRDEAIISTKTQCKTRDDAWREIEESLERLRTDYVENLHLHGLASWEDLEQRLGQGGALEALIEAKEQGLIGHIGCTGHRNELLAEAIRRFPFETVLCVLNMVVRDPLDELIPLCRERGVGVTVMKGFSKGRLPADLSLKWLLSHDVQCVVPGAISVGEIEENAAVGNGDLTLTPEDATRVAALQEAWDRGCCDVCGRCMPCPANVAIPGILGTDGRIINYRVHGADGYGQYVWAREYAEGEIASRHKTVAAIEACADCGDCEARCPRGLPIVQLLRDTLPVHRGIIEVYQGMLAR